MQAAQIRSIQIPGGGNGTRRQAFDIELWKRPRDIGIEPWPLGRGRRAQKLHRRGKLRVTAVDRGIGRLRPAEEEGCGEDQVDRDDRGDHQSGDLPADVLQVQEAHQPHDGLSAGIGSGSTAGVNM